MIYKIVSIHGTFAAAPSIRGPQWWQKDSPFSDAVLSYLDTDQHRISWEPFPWSGENSQQDRTEAGRKLAKQMLQKTPLPEKTVYLAHSHGGNVFQNAGTALARAGKHPTGITVGTPYLAERSFNSFATIRALASLLWLGIYLGPASLLALEFFTFPQQVDVVLLYTILGSALALAAYVYLKWSTRTVSDVFAGRGPWYLRLSFHLSHKIRPQQIRNWEVQENLRTLKIYSLLDEAIIALTKAHAQSVAIATPQNVRGPAVVFWTVLVTLLALLMHTIFGLSLHPLPDWARYIALTQDGLHYDPAVLERLSATDNDRMRVIYTDILPDPFWVAVINSAADLTVFIILCLLAGLVLAISPAAGVFARAFNGAVSKILLRKAMGRDVAMTVTMPELTSANLPLLISTYSEGEIWRPMPKDFDDDLQDMLDMGTIETARAIRETLALGMLSDNFNLFSSVSKNFSGGELIHTSYFRHPLFAPFIAWLLVTQHGFPPSDKFNAIAAADIARFTQWMQIIQPAAAPLIAQEA